MRTEGDYEEIARFPDTFIANLWVGRLKAEGILSEVEDDLRQDGFKMAQEAFDVPMVRVYAHRDKAEAARDILRGVEKALIIERA